MRFAYVRAGDFLMGSPASKADRFENELQHRAILIQHIGETFLRLFAQSAAQVAIEVDLGAVLKALAALVHLLEFRVLFPSRVLPAT